MVKSAEEMTLRATQIFGEVEKSPALSACSACAGDYEDPDRTAWTAVESDADESVEWDAPEDELLVEE